MNASRPPIGLSEHSDEFALIGRVAAREVSLTSAGTIGIGDDAAFQPLTANDAGVLVATDTLLEGVHFDAHATPEQIGHKAIAVNLSDIAAMAGVPKSATVALTLPRLRDLAWADRLLKGLQATAHQFDVAVIGGDTTTWGGPLAITVTVLGVPGPAGNVTRNGGRLNDTLFVTGPLGGSITGHHLTFTPRVNEALELVRTLDVHALIDLSDGLASDVRHLMTASGCGAVIDTAAVPVREHVTDDRLHHALTDGEDFELLVAACVPDGVTLPSFLHPVGRLIDTPGVWLERDGSQTPLEVIGYSHIVEAPLDE